VAGCSVLVGVVAVDHCHQVRRECRGLVFSKDGKLLSRRLHKFYNVGEMANETTIDCIDFAAPYVATEKLDGSMICPYVTGGALRMATRMGVTDTALACEAFVRAGTVDYFGFCSEWLTKVMRVLLSHVQSCLIGGAAARDIHAFLSGAM
jgi:hypothetical protein